MPKKYSRRRSMKGGMFEGLTSGWNSITDWSSGAWGKLTGSKPSSTPSYTPTSTPSYTPISTAAPSSGYNGTYDASNNRITEDNYYYSNGIGGKKRRRKSRKMRGGNFTDNTPTTGLAFHAAPFSGETARPNTWVGGKTRKRRKRVKSCRKY